jgi:hypothetical protein
MRRIVLAFLSVVVLANHAAAQTLAASTHVVAVGGTTNLILGGTAGQQFAIIASATNTGLAYAGVSLAVGTDVQVVTIGALDGSGAAVVPVSPPFPSRDRFYYQAVFTTDGFGSITPSNGIVLINAQEARIYLSVGGGVNPNGSGFALSPGVSSTRTSAGNYTVTYPNLFLGVNVIPSITPFCGLAPSSMTATNGQFTVAFASDCGFFFIAAPIRR